MVNGRDSRALKLLVKDSLNLDKNPLYLLNINYWKASKNHYNPLYRLFYFYFF